MSPLASAIKAGNVAKVQQLIANGQANVKETWGTIALSQAAYLGHLEIVQVLIEAGAEVNDEDRIMYPDEAPLARAASQGYLQIVRVLLEAGAEVNIPSDDPEYWTPLMCAVSSGNLAVVKLLVETGADVNEIRGGGNFALMIAAEARYQEIFEYLAPLTDSILRQEAEKVFG
ncbi:ankyrin repeat domain-containing protein [Argonema antarcticum]|uniref:ankyrin repeat domain-containing protein n=1 Tax=Argonema antarcticum TaxID=2942763 RepID=UPI002012F658|nr:ankyrin repeat domain-containing protein [Argonema antarcticum]MCL1474217.1 ankyrin repeat domain-containing protein [Argonema antarcticum A004/B2]